MRSHIPKYSTLQMRSPLTNPAYVQAIAFPQFSTYVNIAPPHIDVGANGRSPLRGLSVLPEN